MATRKPKARPSTTTTKTSPRKLQNLAARPATFDDEIGEEPLADNSGVFRVTSAIAQAQTGHDEEDRPRFANESLVMAAQQNNFPDAGATVDDTVEESSDHDAVVRAERKSRLATLAARARQVRARR